MSVLISGIYLVHFKYSARSEGFGLKVSVVTRSYSLGGGNFFFNALLCRMDDRGCSLGRAMARVRFRGGATIVTCT